jgi:UDP-N-acetylmuramoyl-L-alanyl-D-glutamate--2,6-diaminopimelate ligase
MYLQELLRAIQPVKTTGDLDREITRIDFDSRKAVSGSVFVAIKGVHNDGHAYLDKAVLNGAEVVVVEDWPKQLPESVACIQVSDSAQALGLLAAAFYGYPSRQLRLVGVTGTNGKTTTATLLFGLHQALGYKCGLISTIENKIGEEVLPSHYTTPDAVALNSLLAEMATSGCDFAFMEVSSHAIDQKRIAGLEFAGAVFTNITHDHLDYHKTFDNYIRAKKALFDGLGKGAFALVNTDDRRGMVMVQNTRATVHRYALRSLAEFKAKILENSLEGLHLELDGFDFYARLVGEFNAYNLLAVYAVAVLLGHDKAEVLTELSRLKTAEGRFDTLSDSARRITAIVDYAHTPDALEKVLQTLTKLRGATGRIITVTGCGGDRDKAKRPLMAKAACELSDSVILTSDNPRSEAPEDILADMQKGVPITAAAKVLTIADRRQAIRTACHLAQPGDLVLVAGKGHEKYQEIQGEKYPFDDKEELRAALG